MVDAACKPRQNDPFEGHIYDSDDEKDDQEEQKQEDNQEDEDQSSEDSSENESSHSHESEQFDSKELVVAPQQDQVENNDGELVPHQE